MKRAALVLLAAALLGGATQADEAADQAKKNDVSFFRDVRPIFQVHCDGCHQPAKAGGELVMTSFDLLMKSGESGEPAIVPGKPEESYLMAQITPEKGKADMPKDGKPLTESQIDVVRRWIAAGAKDDTPMSARPNYDMEHPPTYTGLPVLTSLDFSPDGKLLAVSGYHEVVLHHADGSGIAARLVGLSERIESAEFSPDGTRLAVTGGSPGRMGEVQVWDVQKRALILSHTVGYDTCYGASWSPDGKLIGFGCPDNTLRAIDAETGKQVLFSGAHNDWVLDTVFSTKGDHLISVGRDRSMKLVHVKTQRFIDNITSITPGALKGGLNAIDCHPARDELLTGGADGAPKIYQMIRTKARKIGDDFNLIRAFPPMPGRLFAVAFDKKGERIVAGSSLNNRGEIRVYNVADGKQLAKYEVADGGIYAVAFSPDGKTIAAGGFAGQVLLLDAATGKPRKQFPPVEVQPTVAAAKPAAE